MIARLAIRPVADLPAVLRLAALNPLDDDARTALALAMERPRTVQTRRELLSEGRPVGEPMLVLDGWAARVRLLPDGRRQILNFVLPGDIVGLCGYERPIATTTIAAFTPTTVCPLPDASASPTLERAYAVSRAMDEAHLMAQVTRLGRLSAYERIVDFLLEIYERLSLAGLTANNGYALPLTQEVLADALGLTPVHVNRMLQQARRANDLQLASGHVRLTDIAGLRRSIGRTSTKVA